MTNNLAETLIGIQCREIIVASGSNLAEHRVPKTRSVSSGESDQLNALAHGDFSRHVPVQKLEGRDTQSDPNARGNLIRLGEKAVKQLIEATFSSRHTENEMAS